MTMITGIFICENFAIFDFYKTSIKYTVKLENYHMDATFKGYA